MSIKGWLRRTVNGVAENVAAGRLVGELSALAGSDHRRLVEAFRRIHANVPCPHNESHILQFVVELYKLQCSGAIVEAGSYKGGGTAKLSLVASALGRELVVFDSFAGLPANDEAHEVTLRGDDIRGWFREGQFAGSLDEVVDNVRRFGDISVCRFVPGWFDETMPRYSGDIAAAYLDVDLAASTRTCLVNLYPRISPGGLLMSQDGDFPLVAAVFADESFWESEVGAPMPRIEGLGRAKMLKIAKPGAD